MYPLCPSACQTQDLGLYTAMTVCCCCHDLLASSDGRAGCGAEARPYTDKVGEDDKDGLDMAYRVVADHIRTLSIAIADGAAPGNEGRDYVLRRVLRRAVRYGDKLGGKLGFFSEHVRSLVEQMGYFYPELVAKEDHIREVRAACAGLHHTELQTQR